MTIGVILLRTIPHYEIDSLQMAVEGDCKKFVPHSAVQNLLNKLWIGKYELKSDFALLKVFQRHRKVLAQ